MGEETHAEHGVATRGTNPQRLRYLPPQFDSRVRQKRTMPETLPYSATQIENDFHIATGKYGILIECITRRFEDVVMLYVRFQGFCRLEVSEFHSCNIRVLPWRTAPGVKVANLNSIMVSELYKTERFSRRRRGGWELARSRFKQ